MLRYELKKMLLRRGGLFLMVGLLLMEGVLLFFTQPYDRELEHNRAAYGQYLRQVEGPLTEDKRSFLESEMARLEQNRVDMEALKNAYYNAQISEAEFREWFQEYAPGEAVYIGFTKLFSQYIFVREDPARFFLYTGGWEVLLTDWQPDLLFLLVLVILLTPVFCEEYASGMAQMLLTQKRSARYIVPAKVAAAILVTCSLTAILQLYELLYASWVFGLPHGDYSLRSLMTFGATSGSLTLWQAFWLQFALKELGYLFAALLILFLSVLLKKVSLTLMAGIALLPLPHLAVQEIGDFLPLPGPWALAVGSVYLQSDEAQALIPQIVLSSAVMILGMLWVVRWRNANRQLTRVWKKLFLLGCTAALLAGCSPTPETPVYYNSGDARVFESGRYRIEMQYGEDYRELGYTLLNKDTGESVPFPLDALNGQSVSCGWNFYGEGDLVYYIKTTAVTSEPLGTSPAVSYDTLVRLDLNTMEEQVLYQWNADTRWFFGLLDRPCWEPQGCQLLFLHGGDMYYSNNATICRMDLSTGAWEVFSEDRGSVEVSYDGQHFYYLDSYSRLNQQDLDTGENQVVENVVADRFLLTPEGLFFLNKQDGKKLYLWDLRTGDIRKMSNESPMYMQWRDGKLLITNWAGEQFFLGDGDALHPIK